MKTRPEKAVSPAGWRTAQRYVLLLSMLWLGVAAAHATPPPASVSAAPVRHVFVIVLENEPYQVTFGKHSLAPYLAHELPRQGALLPHYYGIGHYSLDNYIAMISGQAPNPATQQDCSTYSEFKRTAPGLDAHGQALGQGCIYPADVKTIADQLEVAGLSWKGYMEDMGRDPTRESARCGHVAIGKTDITEHASTGDQYADKHNPFVYFHSIIDDPARCGQHVVNFDHLAEDLKHLDPGGLVSADAFLRKWVPRILASPAFRRDGLLVITFDEGTDGKACCGEQGLAGGPLPGQIGPGGGRTGAVLLSPFIKPGTVSTHAYNHYSLLRTVEDFFGLSHLGYAAAPHLRPFGHDVFDLSYKKTQRGAR
jgi:hypothetical protein